MIAIENRGDRVMEITATGTLERADYEQCVPRLERAIEEQGKLRVVIRAEHLAGWTPGALLDELKFDLRHRKDLERVAVVGSGKMVEWGTKLSRPFFSGEVKYFDTSQAQQAMDWVKG